MFMDCSFHLLMDLNILYLHTYFLYIMGASSGGYEYGVQKAAAMNVLEQVTVDERRQKTHMVVRHHTTNGI